MPKQTFRLPLRRRRRRQWGAHDVTVTRMTSASGTMMLFHDSRDATGPGVIAGGCRIRMTDSSSSPLADRAEPTTANDQHF